MPELNIAENISRISIAFLPMLFGIICHEVAHGYAAYRLGDPTAKVLGRLTLNPVRHLDQNGSILFVLTALFSPFIIGWAKPVPIQPRYFKNPRTGMMLTSLAGPMANIAVAVLCGALYAFLLSRAKQVLIDGDTLSPVLRFMLSSARIGIWINVTLAWFNLMPLPPLDGGHILAGILPPELRGKLYQVSRYGLPIMVLLVATGLLRYVLTPLSDITVWGISWLFAIPPRLLYVAF